MEGGQMGATDGMSRADSTMATAPSIGGEEDNEIRRRRVIIMMAPGPTRLSRLDIMTETIYHTTVGVISGGRAGERISRRNPFAAIIWIDMNQAATSRWTAMMILDGMRYLHYSMRLILQTTDDLIGIK